MKTGVKVLIGASAIIAVGLTVKSLNKKKESSEKINAEGNQESFVDENQPPERTAEEQVIVDKIKAGRGDSSKPIVRTAAEQIIADKIKAGRGNPTQTPTVIINKPPVRTAAEQIIADKIKAGRGKSVAGFERVKFNRE